MVQFDDINQESLSQPEGIDSPDEQSGIGADGQARTSSNKRKNSQASGKKRKKKQDALEGKEDNKHRSSEADEDKGHETAHGKEVGKDSGHSSQSLQSGTTTVQFSSGGGVAGALSSLLGLFASSATLVRAASGTGLSYLAQAKSMVLKLEATKAGGLTDIFGSGKAKGLEGPVGNQEQAAVDSGTKSYSSLEVSFTSRGSGNAGIHIGDLLKNVNTGLTTLGPPTTSSQPTPFTPNIGTVIYNPGTIISNVAPPVDLILSFQNSSALIDNSLPYIGVISTYFSGFGLSPATSYTYTVLSPTLSGSAILPLGNNGITVNYFQTTTGNITTTDITKAVLSYPQSNIITESGPGLTLSSSGDLFVNVTQPISVLLQVTPTGSTSGLVVRVNAGPGGLLQSPNGEGFFYNSDMTMAGNNLPNSYAFDHTIFRTSQDYAITGNAPAIMLNSAGDIRNTTGFVTTYTPFVSPPTIDPASLGDLVYIRGLGWNFGSVLVGGFNVADVLNPFPSNTIFKHTNPSTPSSQAAYGNFSSYVNLDLGTGPSATTYSTLTFLPTKSYTLTFGGNVLDVYGTKYGVGDVLKVNLPEILTPLPSPTPINTVNMGSNTLAGFGTAYGDLQTLAIYPQAGNSPTSLGSTIFNFKSNVLAVDLPIGSTLYPHLQTLDLNYGSVSGTKVAPANVKLVFGDSMIQGNTGSDVFYGDIQNLFNPSNSVSYLGFIQPLAVSPVSGHVMVTDNNGNSITWGNNTYTGKGRITPELSLTASSDAYNFTILGNTLNETVMTGHATITDFSLLKDQLNLYLTPDVFYNLDTSHTKEITLDELLPYLTVDPGTNTVIGFKGGGSLTLNNINMSSLSSLSNLTVQPIIDPTPIAEIAVDNITPTTPFEKPPFVYGNGPNNGVLVDTYFNELDKFFSNSILAQYSVTGLPPSSGVEIDQYGSIKVTSQTPILNDLTITATDHNGNTATAIHQFGFLDAPITIAPAGATRVGAVGIGEADEPLSIPNILRGGLNSTLIGQPLIVRPESPDPGDKLTNQTFNIASNLLVDTAGGGKAYGDFQTLTLSAQGLNSQLLTNTLGNSTIQSDKSGVIDDNTITFNPNAFMITNGTVYGVAQTVDLTARGGTGESIKVARFVIPPPPPPPLQNPTVEVPHLTLDTSGNFTDNIIHFSSQQIEGYGTFYQHVDDFKIQALAGTGTIAVAKRLPAGSEALLDVSAHVEDNTFIFDPVTVTIKGDVSTDMTTVYPSIQSLEITVQPTVPKSVGQNFIIDTSATFSDNSFIFGDSTLVGGEGRTTYKTISLTTNTSGFAYNGFIEPLQVSFTSDGHLVTTTTDGFNNAITWGNDTFTGGSTTTSPTNLPRNTYEFILLQDANDDAIFTGVDTITNFDPTKKDVINFIVTPDIFAKLDAESPQQVGVRPEALDIFTSFSTSSGNTVINFLADNGSGNGSLTLQGITFASFAALVGAYSNSITINQMPFTVPSITINPNADFDPVFVSITQELAFAAFIDNVKPSSLTYSVQGVTPTTVGGQQQYQIIPGVVLTSSGSLIVNVSAPTEATVTVIAENEGDSEVLPTQHIFLSNASVLEKDLVSDEFIGSEETGAYEVAASTVYAGGGNSDQDPSNLTLSNLGAFYGSKLIYNTSQGTTHTIYGVTQNITTDPTTSTTNTFFIFNPNLMNINLGSLTNSTDQIFGVGQTLMISFENNSTNSFTGNEFVFGKNKIYGSGTIVGNFQTINLEGISNSTPIQSNTFTFAGNTLISGAYTGGNTLTMSSGPTNLYGSVRTLNIEDNSATGTIVSNNTFDFRNNALLGGSGADSFFGDLQEFGNSNKPTTYGNHNFYNGVTVAESTTSLGEKILTITDDKGNVIRWGNDIYQGGSGSNTYTFTLVGTKASNSPVMQGFDRIMDFKTSTDRLHFNLAYPVYNALANGSPLTAAALLASLVITQTADAAELSFPGGGSIILDGLGTNSGLTVNDLQDALESRITTSLADPITAITNPTNPTNNIVILGQTDPNNTLSYYFNYGHDITSSFAGLTVSSDGTVDFNGNTKIINQSITSMTGQDSYTTVTATLSPALQVLALDAPIIDQTGDMQGSRASDPYGANRYIFIGHGNATITGAVNELIFNATSDPSGGSGLFTFQPKIIYDISGAPDTVYGMGQSIIIDNDGTAAGNFNTFLDRITIGGTYIQASGDLYGNFENLLMTRTNNAAVPNQNSFTFDNSTLIGGTSNDSFHGHFQVYGNSNNPISFGSQNFYNGVTVTSGTSLAITDTTSAGSNKITWGNNTYTGGGGSDTFYFTLVGTNEATPKAVMQGYDRITDFNDADDTLHFNLAYPIYNQLAGGVPLTASKLLDGVTITQSSTAALLTFLGGGSITLDGYGTNSGKTITDIIDALTDNATIPITVSLADPISAISNPTNPAHNIVVLGQTDVFNTLSYYFNYGHTITASLADLTVSSAGAVNFNGNTGIINTTVSSIEAKDSYTTVTATLGTPLQVLALDAPVISNTGNQVGTSLSDLFGKNSYVFIGKGNATIIGGIANLTFNATSDPSFGTKSITYQTKLIYDGTGNADTIYGDIQALTFSNNGTTAGNSNTNSQNITVSGNYIQASGNLHSNIDSLLMIRTNNAAVPNKNTFVFGNDTVIGGSTGDSFYGHLQVFGTSNNPTSYGSQNFYNGVTVTTDGTSLTIADTTTAGSNKITWGNNTYTGNGGSDTFYFTLVGTNDTTPKAVMQGYDKVTDFNTANDKLHFNLAYPLYHALAAGSTLTASTLVASLTVTQTDDAAVITFPGEGKITLDGLGTDSGTSLASLTSALTNSITVSLADPITAISSPTNPANNTVVLGTTDIFNTLSYYFNYGHNITGTLAGLTVSSAGTVNFNGITGILNTTVSSITGQDPYTTVTATLGTPLQVLALNAPVINTAGNQTGASATDTFGKNSYVFIGQGNATITGGISSLTFNASSDPSGGTKTMTYQPKLIYDGTGNSDTVYGDIQTLTISNDGTTSGATNTTSQNITLSGNYIQATGTIYSAIKDLIITSTNNAALPSQNVIQFANSTLVGRSGTNSFYGEVGDFSKTNFVGSNISKSLTSGKVTVTDAAQNKITWGNDTYTGNSGVDTYTFTIMAESSTKDPIMQGFDTITNFSISQDKLVLNVAAPLFDLVNTSNNRTPTQAQLVAGINARSSTTPSAGLDFYFNFSGGDTILTLPTGSLTFKGIQLTNFSSFTNLQINRVYIPEMITANANPTQPLIFKNTGTYFSVFDPYFNNIDIANAGSTYTFTDKITGTTYTNPNLSFSNISVPTVSATSTPILSYIKADLNDVHFNSNDPSINAVVGVFNGTTAIEPASGNFIGSATAARLLQGTRANETMMGNATTISFPAASNQTALVYGTNQYGGNMLINANNGTVAHGVAQTIQFNTPDVTGSKYDFTTNAFYIKGTTYGIAEKFNVIISGPIDARNNTPSFPPFTFSHLDRTVHYDNNIITFGPQTIFGEGTLYGNLDVMSFKLTGGTGAAASLAVVDVSALALNNQFTFSNNVIAVTGSGASSLYAGIDNLEIILQNGGTSGGNIGSVVANAVFLGNTFTFGDTIMLGGSGITNFYSSINDLSKTNFDLALASATTVNGDVRVQDSTTLLNTITFGNDTMTAGTGVSTFNLNLLVTTGGDIVSAGNPTINNFGKPGATSNMLDLQLSTELYNDVVAYATSEGIALSTNSNGIRLITSKVLNSYMNDNHGDVFTTPTGNTVISFSDTLGSNLGKITLTGFTTNSAGATMDSLDDFGTNIQITARGVTTIDPEPDPIHTFNVSVGGDHLSSFSDNVQIANFSSLGQIVDFAGEVKLNMSTALFNALGLSESNTVAQNLQILQQNANTSTGGIAVTNQTTGTGENVATNTVLTFESTVSGQVNTYGSITIHDTNFSPLNPLENHLTITHQ